LLYQLNTRIALTELSRSLGHAATLDDFPDAELDRLAQLGFEWIWLLSVWQTGDAARRVSRSNPQWRAEFVHTLPDLREADIAGSGFAITGYTVHSDLGGGAALVRLRKRMRQRGLKLMLDFVPNHMAPDHAWTARFPDYFVQGTEADLSRAPQNFFRVDNASGSQVFAHGRDPYFDGWPDTVQLNYGNPSLQRAMQGELARIADQCDGVRCDMAMLLVPEVFERTWGIRADAFWPAAIDAVRQAHPKFVFLAEVYWDMEWALQRQGFDYTYDKRLYDRLRDHRARPVREHLNADPDFQNRSARFLENHDEPRAAATFAPEIHAAAAVITFLAPGLRLLHDGQFEGRTVRVSPHLVRRPEETANHEIAEHYERLSAVLRHRAVRGGKWRLLDIERAWAENASAGNFIAFSWQGNAGDWLWVVVNYAPDQGQCFIRLPIPELSGRTVRLKDLSAPNIYERPGDDLLERGLYVELAGWKCHIFEVH
jgi:glycosidase